MTQLLIDSATLELALQALEETTALPSTGARSFDNRIMSIRALRAALAKAGPAGWQPIETAPKDGTSVLAYTHDGYKYPLVCACIFDGGLWWPDSWESPGDQLSPTHWMPLPAAPKDTP